MLSIGFIPLKREILDFGWYHNANTVRLFIHLLLKANFVPHDFENTVINRGQLATSIARLSEELSLSEKEIRTALNHLISSHDIAKKSGNRYTVITILTYDKYIDSFDRNQMPAEGQAKGRRRTGEGQQYNKDKNAKKTSYDLSDIEKIDTLDWLE